MHQASFPSEDPARDIIEASLGGTTDQGFAYLLSQNTTLLKRYRPYATETNAGFESFTFQIINDPILPNVSFRISVREATEETDITLDIKYRFKRQRGKVSVTLFQGESLCIRDIIPNFPPMLADIKLFKVIKVTPTKIVFGPIRRYHES